MEEACSESSNRSDHMAVEEIERVQQEIRTVRQATFRYRVDRLRTLEELDQIAQEDLRFLAERLAKLEAEEKAIVKDAAP